MILVEGLFLKDQIKDLIKESLITKLLQCTMILYQYDMIP
jgi:hypothetical protein